MQILPLPVNREVLKARTLHADLETFRAYCRDKIKAASAPDYFKHNRSKRLLRRFLAPTFRATLRQLHIGYGGRP